MIYPRNESAWRKQIIQVLGSNKPDSSWEKAHHQIQCVGILTNLRCEAVINVGPS